jgi:hypothetical protein
MIGDLVSGALVVGMFVVGVVFVMRAVAPIRRRRVNKWFMAGYRAGHRHASRSTVDRGRHSL